MEYGEEREPDAKKWRKETSAGGDSLQPWHIRASPHTSAALISEPKPKRDACQVFPCPQTHMCVHALARRHMNSTNTDFTFTKSEIVSESCFTSGGRMHCKTPCEIRVLSSVPACSRDKSACGTRRPRRQLSHASCPGHRHLHPPYSGKQDPATAFARSREAG